MNAQDIFDGVTDIRADLIQQAADKTPRRRAQRRWLGAAAALLALAVLGGALLHSGGLTAYAIAQAEYPHMAPYPDEAQYSEAAYNAWRADMQARQRDLGDICGLQRFFARSAPVFLSGQGNRVCSPLNIYMGLAVLAQLTQGESRQQLLTLLGADSMETLRQQAGDVWNVSYRDDGVQTCTLANSLWLDEGVGYVQETLRLLADAFYASSYQGKMGSPSFDKALQSWLDRQTGGLLTEQAENIRWDSETVLGLATTVYFRARWNSEFSRKNTVTQTFHTPDGDTQAAFMYQRDDQNYYWGAQFAAVNQPFEGGGSMWFVLPDEGVTPEDLLADAEVLDFLFAADKNAWENQRFLFVNKSVPRFDIACQFDLVEGLQTLGVTGIFDPAQADFGPITTDTSIPVVLSQARHAARVTIDEEGCTAAAFTVYQTSGAAAPPEDEVDFVLDRPFLFCITTDSGLPLFVGVVCYPAA